MPNIQLVLAIMVGKTIITVNRFLGKKGTSLPGMVALKICPNLISQLRRQHDKVIVVTGTNGKTTTSNLLAEIFIANKSTLTHNTAGANMASGIATAFIEASNIYGQTTGNIAIIETDEATMPIVLPDLKPDMVIVTNFFRDQLDRYGELDKTIQLTVDAISKQNNTEVVLNADDPLVATIGRKVNLPVKYFGIAQNKYSIKHNTQVIEGRYCPFCQGEYQYDYYQYGQLGGYTCPQCGYKRPQPDFLISEMELIDGISFTLVTDAGQEEYNLSLQGFYNVYNALAAVTAALEAGIDSPTIKKGLTQYAPNAGRMEKFNIRGHEATLALVKNPTGFNEVIKTAVRTTGQKNLVIAINDLAADGRDVSWLWDVDFEILADATVENIVCSGLRGEDMAVRLKYAGVPADKILFQKNLKEAINICINQSKPENKIYILPTYTNLFATAEILQNMTQSTEVNS